ncbi:zinc-ribbon domain-containing protein [Phocaeicola salanitronis]|uniref:zinc-ribbon domain-containing protein n=1 Tax=Phocaeicola salanitronis TaxID=376805 RepID=UPI003F4F0679
MKWKCANPDHKPYFASVYARTKLGSKCPECSGNIKSPQSYKKEVVSKFPTIELLSDYKKSNMRISCRCKLCGYEWQPFPFNLLRGKGCPKCKNELTNCNTSSHLPKKKI